MAQSIERMISIQELIEMMNVIDTGPCPYLPDRQEKLRAIRCPGLPNALHARMMEYGFRHSRDIFYLTACDNCGQCIPMRIDPIQFRPSKKQRHIFNKNADIEIRICAPNPTEEKFDIYRRYMETQHADSKQPTSFESMKSLFSTLPSSAEIQYCLDGKIVGITIADIIPEQALSSVYHFYDPDYARRSIGVFSMIAEIRLCELMHIPFFYPGLWVPNSPKMQYKNQYRPNQILVDGVWCDHE